MCRPVICEKGALQSQGKGPVTVEGRNVLYKYRAGGKIRGTATDLTSRSHSKTQEGKSLLSSQETIPNLPKPLLSYYHGCFTKPHSRARTSVLLHPTGGLQPEFNDLAYFKHLLYFKPQGSIQKTQ